MGEIRPVLGGFKTGIRKLGWWKVFGDEGFGLRVDGTVGRSDNLEGNDDIVFPLFVGEVSPLSLP